jgi:hypothetical protein
LGRRRKNPDPSTVVHPNQVDSHCRGRLVRSFNSNRRTGCCYEWVAKWANRSEYAAVGGIAVRVEYEYADFQFVSFLEPILDAVAGFENFSRVDEFVPATKPRAGPRERVRWTHSREQHGEPERHPLLRLASRTHAGPYQLL